MASILRYFGRNTNSNNAAQVESTTLSSRENFSLPVKRNSMTSTSEDEVNLSETSNSVAGSGSAIQWDYFDSIPDDLEIGKDPISLPEDCYYSADGIMLKEPSNIDFSRADQAKKFGLEIDCENINKFDPQLIKTCRYGEMEKCSPDSIEPSEMNLIEPSSIIIEKNEIDNDDFTKLYLSQPVNIDSDTDIPPKYFSVNGDNSRTVVDGGNNPLIPNNYLRNYTIATVDSCFEDVDTPAQLPVLHKHPRVQHPIHLKDYDIDSLEGSQNGFSNLEVTEEESITQVIEASASQSQSQDKAFWSSRSSSTAREIKPLATETTTLVSESTSAICDKEVQAINGLKSSGISKSFDKIDEASSDDTLVNCEDIDDDENQSRSKRGNTVRFSSENIFIPISRSNSSPDEAPEGEPRRRRVRRTRHVKNDEPDSFKDEKVDKTKSSIENPAKTSEQFDEDVSEGNDVGVVRGELENTEYTDEEKPDSFSFEISQGEKLSLDMELLQSGNILRPSGTFVEEKMESDETCSLTSVTNSATSENEIHDIDEKKVAAIPKPPCIIKHQIGRTRHTSSCGDIVKYEIQTRKGKSSKVRYDNFHIKKEDSNLIVNFNISDDLIEPSYNNLMTREIKKYASEPIALNHKHLNNSGENPSEIDIFIEAITKENSCECMNSMVDVRGMRDDYLRGYCIENVQQYTKGNYPSSLPNLRHPALVNGNVGHDEFLKSCIQNGDIGNAHEITDDAILSSEKNFEEEKINASIDHDDVQSALQIHQVKKSKNPFRNSEEPSQHFCNGELNRSATEIEKYLSVSFEIKQGYREDDTAESNPFSNKICDFVNLIMEPNSTFSEYDSELTPLHDVIGDKDVATISESKSDFTIHKEKQALINAELLGSSRENGSSRIESSSLLSDCSSSANKNEQTHVTSAADNGGGMCNDVCACARKIKTLRPIACISDDEFFIPISKEDTSAGNKKYFEDHLVAMQSSIQTPLEKSPKHCKHGNPFRRASLKQDSHSLRNYDPVQQSFFSSSINGQENGLYYEYDHTIQDESMYMSRNSIDFLNGSQTYTNEISEEEKIMLKLEALHLKGKALRDTIGKTVHQQNDLISNWKLCHLGENIIQAKIKKLREVQIRLESEEDYDEANLVNQQIKELVDQGDNYKYQQPLLDRKFVELMKNYENLCNRQKSEHGVMRREYESIKQWFYAKNDTEVKSEEEKMNQVNSLLRDKRMKIERGIRFTHLNKQHLVKNEKILKDEMETLTRELNKEQQKLNEERTIIQVQIKELIAKLVPLQDKEESLSTTVTSTSEKIQGILDEFQPRLDAIKTEVDAATQEQSRLTIALDRIATEEEKIKVKSGEIASHREKNEEIISVIETNIEKIQKATQMSEKEFFKLEKFIDFEGLILDADGELMRTKEQLEEYQAKLKELTNKVLADEWEEKRLQRTLNDLETQIAEFQKLKQVLVKERNYEDAKMTYEEIRSLISEGEMLSCVAMKFNEGIKLQKIEIEKTTKDLSRTKKQFHEMELANDQSIVERLKKMNGEIDHMLNSNPGSWCVGILQLQVFNNNNIIQDLSKKHRLLPGKVHGKIEAIKKSLEVLESTMEDVIS